MKKTTDFPQFLPSIKPRPRYKDDFCFAIGCLTVCVSRWWAGRDSLGSRKNPKRRKRLKMATNPTSRLHALLATVFI